MILYFLAIIGILPVSNPIALNGSVFGFADISPVSGLTLPLNKFICPNVCWYSSNATLCLNSLFKLFAPIFAKSESCVNEPSDPEGLSLNKILYGVYVEGKNINVLSELA